MSDDHSGEPDQFLGFTRAAWVDAYTRFGPSPARARADVDEFFASQRQADGRLFYQLEWLIPMAYANRGFAADLRDLIARMGATEDLDSSEDRAGFPGSDEHWRGYVADMQESAAKWRGVLADLERHHGSRSLA